MSVIKDTNGDEGETVCENIYRLVEDIKEFSFKKIDSIALKHGYQREDKRRGGQFK